MNYPPDSFWILIETDKLDSHVLSQDSKRVNLAPGRWHCLPDYWKEEAIQLARESQSAYSPIRVHLWPITLAPVRSN